MSTLQIERLSAIPRLRLEQNVPLSQYTRFAIGGPASVYVETADEQSFIAALKEARSGTEPWVVIGGGTNLIVSDRGFDGIVLRFTGAGIRAEGTRVIADAGAVLQDLVDFTIARGLARIHTMTGIPGTVGAAVYGNAGAYGHSISESVREVRFFDGDEIRTIDNAACEFAYRESVFKRHKHWVIFSTTLDLEPAGAAALRTAADDILRIRNEKYPPSMRCAGSIFKNLILAELPDSVRAVVPARVIREGKVPSAYFLEQVGAKGMKDGDIHVADYHANLIYNAGQGTATQLAGVIRELKTRVRREFGFELEEEVQYVGFNGTAAR
jgi:UDP-N-acetylmuramate dehydrogenase